MKNTSLSIKKSVVAITIGFATICASCSDWIDTKINIDPDSPSDVPMNLILPAVQVSMGYNLLGNDAVRTNNIWMQQFDGVARQSYTEGNYQITPSDVNNLWGSIYTEMLINSQIIINKSMIEGSESPNFRGVAQVLQATTLGISTDLYGDMPFTEALNGTSNVLQPAYDSQESIYNSIFSLLEEASVNLNSSNNVYTVSGDVIYNGNITKWKKAANAIKARHYLQLSNILGAEAYTKALQAVANGFTSNADDMLVPFDTNDKNPIHQFMLERGDIRMGSTLVDMLKDDSDPRLPFYVAPDSGGAYVGSTPGSQNETASRPGTYVSDDDSSVRLMTYSELKFIEAEARFMLNPSDPLAQTAFEQAVAASVLRVTGADNTTWLNDNIIGVPITLELIIKQKYIDGFATNQPYADYRRTGFPVIANLPPDAVLPAMPTRFPYPQDELSYNQNNVPTVTPSTKLWWDQ